MASCYTLFLLVVWTTWWKITAVLAYKCKTRVYYLAWHETPYHFYFYFILWRESLYCHYNIIYYYFAKVRLLGSMMSFRHLFIYLFIVESYEDGTFYGRWQNPNWLAVRTNKFLYFLEDFWFAFLHVRCLMPSRASRDFLSLFFYVYWGDIYLMYQIRNFV